MGADHCDKPTWLKIAERQGLVSAMNATKWREATEAMRHLAGGPPRFCVKDINSTHPGEWNREWYYHPRPFETIEWLDLDPDSRIDQVLAALTTVGAPFVVRDGLIRIAGWLRPKASPSA